MSSLAILSVRSFHIFSLTFPPLLPPLLFHELPDDDDDDDIDDDDDLPLDDPNMEEEEPCFEDILS